MDMKCNLQQADKKSICVKSPCDSIFIDARCLGARLPHPQWRKHFAASEMTLKGDNEGYYIDNLPRLFGVR